MVKRFLGKNGCLILGNDLRVAPSGTFMKGWATADLCLQERLVETAVVAFGKSRQEEIANRIAHKYSVHVHIALEQTNGRATSNKGALPSNHDGNDPYDTGIDAQHHLELIEPRGEIGNPC